MIKDLKEFQKLLKICRSQGITDLKYNGLEVKFGELPSTVQSESYREVDEPFVNPYDDFPDELMSPEQLAYYANGGLPQDDPFRKGN
jgi:hypothetical protein